MSDRSGELAGGTTVLSGAAGGIRRALAERLALAAGGVAMVGIAIGAH